MTWQFGTEVGRVKKAARSTTSHREDDDTERERDEESRQMDEREGGERGTGKLNYAKFRHEVD